ncbi:acyl-CoA dehydrogenase family protein [Pontiella sulfatireligans]|uniref:Acyl-CoA dehydrogenase n=1 Tax=Pontiella sulfatireligans TaxID=2750658 RepID=A0A6C2UQS4_9BACT|nr:acyl-CoA dehydrogenase family protein [Pontiella sulfatireligans]VGO21621.1 Acyl-CoA dehydrogenase [Pontiella sulfatireligans]
MHETLDQYLRSYFASTPDYHSYDEAFLTDFLKMGPLRGFIPTSLGGTYDGTPTCMAMLETVSYHCLPLGLALGITGSLFLQPMAKLAPKELSERILPRFLNSAELGGMMITEPTGGTDIFGLRSTLETANGQATLNGVKCWGGLTGRAEHWLVAARIKKGGKLTRRVAMVYVPLASKGVAVEEYFDALGLQPIAYGRTRYSNVTIPESYVITPPGGSALRDILDTLFRSRMGVSAIAAGQCRRLVDEVTERANSRVSFGRIIAEYDQVQFRLSGLRGMEQVNQSLWHFVGDWKDSHNDVSGDQVLANAVKVMSTDALTAAADSAVQVFAGAAYKRSSVIGRSFTDSRPFQIFEGSNDVLLENTYEVLASRYGGVDPETVGMEFERYGLSVSNEIPAMVREALVRKEELSQRQKVLYGKIVSWMLVQAVLEQESSHTGRVVEDGTRLAHRHMAAHAAEMPYMG